MSAQVPFADRGLTTENVKERLDEAADTLRRLPFPRGGRPSTRVGMLYECVPDPGSFWPSENARTKPAAPRPEAITRTERTLGWLLWLEADERKIVWGRACGLRWRRLEAMDGRCERTLRSLQARALGKIQRRLASPMQKAA